MTAPDLAPDQPRAIAHWIVTFEEAWRTEVHPTPLPAARRCHPDGFVLVRCYAATAADEVRSIVSTLFFAFFKDVERWNSERPPGLRAYPLGCLGTYDASERVWRGGGL